MAQVKHDSGSIKLAIIHRKNGKSFDTTTIKGVAGHGVARPMVSGCFFSVYVHDYRCHAVLHRHGAWLVSAINVGYFYYAQATSGNRELMMAA
jgi:hypothetical protein